MGQLSTFAGLALVSSVLAAFVPGVSDASGSPPNVTATVQAASVSAGTVGSGAIQLIAAVERPAVIVPVAPAEIPTITVRRRMMVGCERAVSPLVRSAEAAQIARCIT